MSSPSTPLPVLLTAEERSDLGNLLAHTARFDHGGYGPIARRLEALLDDPDRVGEPTHSYVLAGPWGTITEGDGSLAATIAGCRQARAAHWAEGHGRDERYAQIQVHRHAHVYTEHGQFIGAAEVVEVPDHTLTQVEAAENERRIESSGRVRDAINAYLRDAIDRGVSDIRVPAGLAAVPGTTAVD